jgi:D-sedoheptulose 7-phosphate isomerase
MPDRELVLDRLREAQEALGRVSTPETADVVVNAAAQVASCLREGGRILLCGNGGSQADAQHLAAEFIGRFLLDREPFSAIALGDNIAAVTAVGNDYSYDEVFVRGVRAHGRAGDVLIGLSTSGSSKNVVQALAAATEIGMATIAFVGEPGSPLAGLADHVLAVPGASTARTQEAHQVLGHTLIELVERDLCS